MNEFQDEIVMKNGKIVFTINDNKIKIHNTELFQTLILNKNRYLTVVLCNTVNKGQLKFVLNNKTNDIIMIYKTFLENCYTFVSHIGNDFYIDMLEIHLCKNSKYESHYSGYIYFLDKNDYIIMYHIDIAIEDLKLIKRIKNYKTLKKTLEKLEKKYNKLNKNY